ncbi:MAG: LemA family protein [Gemmatimonadales bacterium]|nr:LemA family protein [Gemmatimonadales bacterium]MCB9518044.1 LemA family protein [Gemmatimonadales bacterium]HRX19012.1 LemA family protein [Gemmatimonadales bacterium]
MPPRLGLLLVLALGAALVWLAWTWNRLVALRAAMRAAWASVDALLKRRADLIPNLVEVVRGAMDFEAGTLERVVSARSQALGATDRGDRAAAESQLAGTVRHLFAVVERYPELKANTQILSLQRELAETESDIASARRYYNAVVRDLNIMREQFPNVLVANALGFAPGEYFELADGDRAVPSTALEPGA